MLEPQLATVCTNLDKLNYPIIAEPKLDGVRCLIDLTEDVVKVYSRTLKPLVNFTELVKELTDLRNNIAWLGNVTLDGEIVATDGTFDSTVSRSRAHEGVNDHIGYKYHIFDAVVHGTRFPLAERKLRLLGSEGEYFTTVPYSVIDKPEDVIAYNNLAIEDGFEGIMLKEMYGFYRSGRSRDWQKLKPFLTADLKIIGMTEGKGKASGMMGRIVVEGEVRDNGGAKVCSEVGTGFTDELRKGMWLNQDKYLGKVAEIQYQEVTKAGSLRFPSFKRMRDDLND